MASVRALEEERSRLQGPAEAIDGTVRWALPENYHITLVFLGWTRRELLSAIRDRVERKLVGACSSEFQLVGMGAFPSEGDGRVLWAGIDPPGAARLAVLAAGLREAVRELGFKVDQRDFVPHVTLGRSAKGADWRSLIDRRRGQSFGSSLLGDIVLFRSETEEGITRYRECHVWPLGPCDPSTLP